MLPSTGSHIFLKDMFTVYSKASISSTNLKINKHGIACNDRWQLFNSEPLGERLLNFDFHYSYQLMGRKEGRWVYGCGLCF
jgi:hypothetical protein